MSCGVGHRSGVAVAVVQAGARAPIRPLAWEPPYVMGVALKRTPPPTHTHNSFAFCSLQAPDRLGPQPPWRMICFPASDSNAKSHLELIQRGAPRALKMNHRSQTSCPGSHPAPPLPSYRQPPTSSERVCAWVYPTIQPSCSWAYIQTKL